MSKLRRVALAAAVVTGMSASVANAFTADAYTWLSVGIFSRFNVVTSEDFTALASDQDCGFAAGRDVTILGGYTVGKARNYKVGDPNKREIAAIIGRDLNWTGSGTIGGDVYIAQNSNVTISPNSMVTQPAPYAVYPLTPASTMLALDPEMWVGYAGSSTHTGGVAGYTNMILTNAGVVLNQALATPSLPMAFAAAFNDYLGTMGNAARSAPANGVTTVSGSTITLDGKNQTLKDMPARPPSTPVGNANLDGSLNVNRPAGVRTVYVFDVNGSDIGNARSIRLVNAPLTDATYAPYVDPTYVVVRVRGSGTVNFAAMGMQDFAPRNTRTMWLFDDAITGINITGVGFEGTIVAKNAAVTGGAGQFNGTILAKSFNAQLEGHCAPFESYLDVTN